uniref:Multidrug resistance protein n=1 Tax=Oryza nivara TaxID=4536 RepID=A0A0E0G346_ORYNI
MGGGDGGAGKAKARPVFSSFMTVFMHADAADVALMVLGLLGAMGDGISTPVMLLITSRIFNDLGSGADIVKEFSSKVNVNARNLVFLAAASWVMAFLEGYCWARTAERQASRMRARYLRAVLRQDVEYFDLKKGSTAEVITSVSNDSLVVQDVLSEKVPNFVMNAAMFAGSYAVGFALLWRLTLVALPSVVLLIIPGFMYGRILVGLARRIREHGSGKSTVIALLERFYDPLAGEVTVDGVDIRRLRLKWLRAQMGLVSQEPALFATSIRENILFGKEEATAEEVVAAAKAANAHNFISQLPQGYDTQVGERGVQMSGGQKQRIAIARAILKSPKILLLDEATSALDTESERVVQEALDLASMGRTTIVIAHRLSTIRNADIIAVMQSGEVKELGPHDELIANDNGLYSSLVRLQQTRDSNEIDEIGVTGSTSAVGQSSSHSMSRRFSAASRSSSARSLSDARDDDNTEKPKLPVPSFRRLLMLNAPEWKQALMGSFSAVVFGGIQPAYAYAMGSMISVYFLTDHAEIKDKTRTYALIFVGLAVLSFLINIGQHYNFGAMGEYLTKRIREQMLAKILTFEIGWFDRDENSSGAICSQLAKDANVVRSLVGDRMALVIQTISAVLIACTMGLVIAWRLALVMIAVQPLIIVCFYARRVLLKSMSKKSIHAQAESSKLAAEAVSNLRTITAFSSQERILHLFEQSQDGPRKESIRQSWFAGLGLGTSMSLMTCTWALDFWYGGRLMAEHHISAKELFQTFMILVSTGRVIADAGSMTTDLAKGADAVASVFAVLDRETEIDPDNPQGYKPEKLKGEVDIRGVDFAYPSRPDVIIFKGFTLSIQPGKSTALVGQSGSGKSTIIGLIERFYDPIRGSVKIDGRDIKAYNLRALRRHIGLVSQEPTLFAGTIRENIVYGTETASEVEIEDAARSANAHDFISNLKDGYDTWCGERGVQLSGGQKQRIAIARAILKNPAILLLDEATSALDSQSEKVVQEALDRVMIGRTSVVVAHRLSTIQNCDLITVLEKGTVVEKGTHASLMAKGLSGTYFSLVNLQQGGNQQVQH